MTTSFAVTTWQQFIIKQHGILFWIQCGTRRSIGKTFPWNHIPSLSLIGIIHFMGFSYKDISSKPFKNVKWPKTMGILLISVTLFIVKGHASWSPSSIALLSIQGHFFEYVDWGILKPEIYDKLTVSLVHITRHLFSSNQIQCTSNTKHSYFSLCDVCKARQSECSFSFYQARFCLNVSWVLNCRIIHWVTIDQSHLSNSWPLYFNTREIKLAYYLPLSSVFPHLLKDVARSS